MNILIKKVKISIFNKNCIEFINLSQDLSNISLIFRAFDEFGSVQETETNKTKSQIWQKVRS